MKIIDEQSKKFHLNEIGHGAKEVKFAIINPTTGETLTPFCKCKDYFTDMFWSNKTKGNVDVCGFKWKPNQDGGLLDKDTFSIAIKLQDKSSSTINKLSKKETSSIKALLNVFEKKLKFPLTKTEVSDDENYVILNTSKQWKEVPYLVSALFMLIRLGFTYELKTNPIEYFTGASSKKFISPNDESYFKQVKGRFEDLYAGKVDRKQTFEMYNSASDAHGSSGIVGYHNYSV